MSSYRRFSLLALLVLVSCTLAAAQSTFGSFVGTVQDPSGARVSGATVVLRNVDENITISRESSISGEYLFINQKPGHYELSVRKDGFTRTVVSGLLLDARQEQRVNLQLKVQSGQETVQVSGDSQEINTENATIADSKDGALLAELPVNYRGNTSSTSPLAALNAVPGVQQDANGNVSINGASPTQVSYSLDGISTVNSLAGGANSNMYASTELIGEFRVSSASNTAEFASPADVTVTTKSGGNTYHGSLFEYLQNAALDATTYGAPIKQSKVGNTFGGSLGGPVRLGSHALGRDRLFFFADYEGVRLPHSSLEQYELPTQALRNGDLNSLVTPSAPITNPATGQPFANNTITNISSVSQKLLNYLPVPSGGSLNAPNYSVNKKTPTYINGYDARVDYLLNSRQQLYARWSWKSIDNTNWPGINSSYSQVQSSLVPASDIREHDKNLVVSHTYALSSSLQNEFRFGLSLYNSVDKFPLTGKSVVEGLGITGEDLSAHPNTGGFPVFDFSAGTGLTPIGRQKDGPTTSKVYQFTDNVSWAHGHHTFKFGADAQLIGWTQTQHFAPGDDYGAFYFTGGYTGNAYADFLLGLPAYNLIVVTGADLDSRAKHFGVYGQDEFRITSRLTLSYGLRWELHPPFTEQKGNLGNFDPKTGSLVVPDHTLPASQDVLTAVNACSNRSDNSIACIPLVNASSLGLGPGLRHTYYGNFDPRIALAYRPFDDNKTVLRAGFGIFTPNSLGAASYLLSGVTTNYFAVFSGFQFPAGEPSNTATTFTPGSTEIECAVDPNLRDPAIAQWNVTVERELPAGFVLRSSYIGSNAYRLENLVDLNQQHPSAATFSPLNGPFPQFDKILSSENVAGANFQSWQNQIERRYRNGAYLQATYTWAKSLTNAEGSGPTSFANQWGGTTTNRFNLRGDRGNDFGTRRQRLVVNGVYALPFGQGHALLNDGSRLKQALVGGWKLSSIALVETGPYQTPTISCALDQSGTNPEAGMGQACRPDRVGNGSVKNPSPGHWYDINAFQATPSGAGRFGNSGVGILKGPGTVTVAAGIAKEIKLDEHTRLRFEATFTNLFNHPNFAPPGVNVSSPSAFGVTDTVQTSENAGNRTGQLALRLDF